MAGGAILKILYGYISTIFCAINAKFGMRKHHHVWHRSLDQMPNFENSRWRTAAVLKIVLSLRFGRRSSDFNEIWWRCKF